MKIGLALGGGGAKGFAHLPVLEVFDELQLRPDFICGTSIGAVLGGLYASGMSARQITDAILTFFPPKEQLLQEIFQRRHTQTFIHLLDPSFKPGSFFKGERVIDFLYQLMGTTQFRDLEIPLKTVATDFWRREEVVLDSGDVLRAIRASMAIPYVFTPIIEEDRVLVDGGLVNNLPSEHLPKDCDITVAVDISGTSSTPKNKLPGAFDAIFYTYQVMMDAMTQQKLKYLPVDIYVRPPLVDVEMLEFHRALEIYQQGEIVKADFRQRLLQQLERFQQGGGDMAGRTMEQFHQLAHEAEKDEEARRAERKLQEDEKTAEKSLNLLQDFRSWNLKNEDAASIQYDEIL